MGGVVSYLLSFLAPAEQLDPTPDPTTGLTQRDRQAITESWSIIADKDNLKKNAVEFFIQLFVEYPYLQDYFKLFKDKPLSELRNNPKLKFHATSVFYTITSFVEHVDDPETLVGLIQKIAVSHIERGITVKEFEDLKVVFLKFAKAQLGPKCTPEVATAWSKLLTAHNSVYKATNDEVAGTK